MTLRFLTRLTAQLHLGVWLDTPCFAQTALMAGQYLWSGGSRCCMDAALLGEPHLVCCFSYLSISLLKSLFSRSFLGADVGADVAACWVC